MEADQCETLGCHPFNLNLRVKITVEPQPEQVFSLEAWPGQSLINVLKMANGTTISSETKDDVPDSGPYVVGAKVKGSNGKDMWFRNEGDKFWTTVLYNEGSMEKIKPIDLNYKVQENDTVSLKFSYF